MTLEGSKRRNDASLLKDKAGWYDVHLVRLLHRALFDFPFDKIVLEPTRFSRNIIRKQKRHIKYVTTHHVHLVGIKACIVNNQFKLE